MKIREGGKIEGRLERVGERGGRVSERGRGRRGRERKKKRGVFFFREEEKRGGYLVKKRESDRA